MKKTIVYFLFISLLGNFYFIFKIVNFSTNDVTINARLSNLSHSDALISVEGFFNKEDFQSIKVKKVFDENLIYKPYAINQLITNSYKFSKDSNEVRRYFVSDFFPKLLKLYLTSNYDFDSLNALLNAGVKYRDVSLFVPDNELIFTSFSQLIFEQVSQKITQSQSEDKGLSNRLDFQILVNKCIENNYYPDLKESSTDKFLKTLLEKDYFHLINTGYQKSSIYQKITIGFMFLLMIMGFMYFINLIKK